MANHLVLTYGSLRKDEYNFKRFIDNYPKEIEWVETIKIQGYDLYSLYKGSYSGIVEGNGAIICDVLNVTSKVLSSITTMEKGAGYDIKEIEVEGKKYFIYLYKGKINTCPRVINGDWCMYRKYMIDGEAKQEKEELTQVDLFEGEDPMSEGYRSKARSMDEAYAQMMDAGSFCDL